MNYVESISVSYNIYICCEEKPERWKAHQLQARDKNTSSKNQDWLVSVFFNVTRLPY